MNDQRLDSDQETIRLFYCLRLYSDNQTEFMRRTYEVMKGIAEATEHDSERLTWTIIYSGFYNCQQLSVTEGVNEQMLAMQGYFLGHSDSGSIDNFNFAAIPEMIDRQDLVPKLVAIQTNVTRIQKMTQVS